MCVCVCVSSIATLHATYWDGIVLWQCLYKRVSVRHVSKCLRVVSLNLSLPSSNVCVATRSAYSWLVKCAIYVYLLFYFLLLSQISYGDGASVEVDGRLGQKLVTKLKPQSLYTFMLTSKADSTGGLQHRTDAMTAPNLLTKKPQLLDKTSSQSIATLQLPTVQGQANVRSGIHQWK